MSEHKLSPGISIINRLNKLGKLLNYYSEKEYIIDEKNKSAVDVAWLFEKEQKYPLFIFEVESRMTNSLTANPLKVFAETNQKFEKPLFLFHLILDGGLESSKIPQLERAFGTYNYRIYRFGLQEEVQLIKDILSQHRRLTNTLDVTRIIIEILSYWKEVEVDSIILHIEELEFEKYTGVILPSYAKLLKLFPQLTKHYIRRLKNKVEDPNDIFSFESYGSYLGTQWGAPIHLGLLAAFANDNQEEKYFDLFKKWQENSSYMKQIGPYFQLSRDYDFFILSMSGALLSLTAILFKKVPNAGEYICKQLFDIVQKSERFDIAVNLNNCLWMLHLSIQFEGSKQYFQYARNLLNACGGVPKLLLLNPCVNYSQILEGDEMLESFGDNTTVPDWEEFILLKTPLNPNQDVLFEIVINYLIDNNDNWNPIIAKQM